MTHPAPELRLVESERPPEAAAPDPLIGQTLDGRYRIERQLGQGGMGLVYEAAHVMLGKRLAIKVLKPEVSRDEQVIARFRREAQSASAIGSPHICDVSDFGTLPDGATYFVMEFLDGPSLSDAMKQQHPMSVDTILSVAIQMCDALGAAHERGIVHRDLKPDNIHLVRQGNRDDFVKVLDFGIAKVGGAADKKLTQAGQVFGTPHYMSPEQCSGRDVDHRTDLYAVGVILYEMATGKVPFDADNLMGVLTKHVYEQPIPPREFPPPVDVPPGLEAVILRCLEKQADARYQTMSVLKADLERVRSGGTPEAVMNAVERTSSVPKTQMITGANHGALQMAPGTPAPEAAPSGGGGKGLVLGLAAAAVLVLGGGAFAAAFVLGGDDADDTPPPIATPEVTDETPEATDETPEVAVETPEATDETPPPAAPVMVTVSSDPAGAEVYSGDGVLIGNTPIEIERPAAGDTVPLRIGLTGHEDREFTVSSLTRGPVTVRLDPVERRRAARRGRHRPRVESPTPRPLAPSNPPPQRRRERSMGSEIISPW